MRSVQPQARRLTERLQATATREAFGEDRGVAFRWPLLSRGVEPVGKPLRRRKGVGSLFLIGKIDDGVSGSRTCLAQTMIFMLMGLYPI